jgi:hypothetical protein
MTLKKNYTEENYANEFIKELYSNVLTETQKSKLSDGLKEFMDKII